MTRKGINKLNNVITAYFFREDSQVTQTNNLKSAQNDIKHLNFFFIKKKKTTTIFLNDENVENDTNLKKKKKTPRVDLVITD